MTWTHLIFEAYCSHKWNIESEYLYGLDPITHEFTEKIKNPKYDPNKKIEPKPDYCPGNPCYTCWENKCKHLICEPVKDEEYSVMMDAWRNLSTDES